MTAAQLFDPALALSALGQALREAPCFVTEEDMEDLGQEAMVALWQAARGYPECGTHMPFPEYAGIHIRASLREYMLRWFSDGDFPLRGDLDEHAGESVFMLWPEA